MITRDTNHYIWIAVSILAILCKYATLVAVRLQIAGLAEVNVHCPPQRDGLGADGEIQRRIVPAQLDQFLDEGHVGVVWLALGEGAQSLPLSQTILPMRA